MSQEILEKLKQAIEGYKDNPEWEEVGQVMEVGDGIIKISFRSQGGFDVNQFARDHFNGGGHSNAAGGRSDVSMEETVKKFEDLVTKLKI